MEGGNRLHGYVGQWIVKCVQHGEHVNQGKRLLFAFQLIRGKE